MVNFITEAIPYVTNTILVLLSFDSACWSFTLIRHSYWLRKHPVREDIDCDKITHRMLFTTACFSGIHMLAINLSWIYVKVFYGYRIDYFLLIAGINVMVIHLYAVIAKCTDLDKTYWPHCSILMANNVISPCRNYILRFNKKDKAV
jgi:hypothetical protein